MITITRTTFFNNIDLNNPQILITSDILFVECTEVYQDRFNNPEKQLEYRFGLTHLGGLTTQLDNKNIEEIIKYNYTIEEQNQVGLCLPFNLVIVPFSFFLKVFTNKFDSELNKYIDDIIKANESHQKRTNIYINFKDASSSGKPHYWEDENIKNKSLDNLENILFTKEYSHAKHIYLNC